MWAAPAECQQRKLRTAREQEQFIFLVIVIRYLTLNT